MKKICFVFLLFSILTSGLWAVKDKQVKYRIKKTEVKSLSQMGEVDLEAIEQIKGQWMIEDSRFVLEFSNQFACRVDGLRYYHYKRLGTSPRYPYIFTIVKSKKTGHYFFARGYYQDRRLHGNTSQIVFKKDYFIVYSEKDPTKVYFKALRVEKEEQEAVESKK